MEAHLRFAALAAILFVSLPASVYGQAPSDQVPISFVNNMNPHSIHTSQAAGGGVLGGRSNASVLGIDSVVNWSSYFYFPGVDSNGNLQFTWQYTMVGNAPFGQDGEDERGETTTVGAPVIPVNLDLRNFDGTPRFVGGHRLFSDATQFVTP